MLQVIPIPLRTPSLWRSFRPDRRQGPYFEVRMALRIKSVISRSSTHILHQHERNKCSAHQTSDDQAADQA